VRVPVDDHGYFRHRYGHCERKAGLGQRQDQVRAAADRAGLAGARLKCATRDATNVPLFAVNSVRAAAVVVVSLAVSRLSRARAPRP
jgi:hypothetical protein